MQIQNKYRHEDGTISETPPSVGAETVALAGLKRIGEISQVTEPVMPRGWTYLIHGTNKVHWKDVDLDQADEIVVKRDGLSVISSRDAEYDKRIGRSTTRTYSSASGQKDDPNNKPLEFRILFYADSLTTVGGGTYDPGVQDIKQSLSPTVKERINTYYNSGNRHPVVPRDERLLALGNELDEDSGRQVYYFVPASVADQYEAAVSAEA